MRTILGCWLGLFLILTAMSTAAADFPLGPGDVVKITVFEHPDMTLETRIADSGRIRFPLVGEVQLGGLTVADAEARIAERLRSGGFVVKPQVNLLVTQFRAQQVAVLGNVNRPGQYPLERASRLSDVLGLASGVSAAGADMVTVTRVDKDGTHRYEINQLFAFLAGDLSQDMAIQGGDVVFVGRAPQFYIHGEVQRPGPYRVEQGMTVMQALSAGGGVTARGTERRLQVTRRTAQGKVVTAEARLESPVEPDDTYFVPPTIYYILGEVQRAGTYKVEPGMSYMQALAVAGGVTPRGTEKGMRVTRKDAKGVARTVDIDPADLVMPDDVIYVKERLF